MPDKQLNAPQTTGHRASTAGAGTGLPHSAAGQGRRLDWLPALLGGLLSALPALAFALLIAGAGPAAGRREVSLVPLLWAFGWLMPFSSTLPGGTPAIRSLVFDVVLYVAWFAAGFGLTAWLRRPVLVAGAWFALYVVSFVIGLVSFVASW